MLDYASRHAQRKPHRTQRHCGVLATLLLVIGLLLGVSGLAPGHAPPNVARAQVDDPVFEPADCPASVPSNQGIRCGYLLVPEDRAEPASPMIRLAVALIPSLDANAPPEPVLYLAGGPGGSALLEAANWAGSAVRLRYHMVLFDQRGTGFSEPLLDCPELDEFSLAATNLGGDREAGRAAFVAAAQTCYERLTAQGANLAAYNSAASAADVEDLRNALNIEAWNLYGISYGTRLAQTIVRDYPASVRSVVLDSAVPLDENGVENLAPLTARVFERLFAACAADAQCNGAYPNLDDLFAVTLRRLDADVATVDGVNPLTGAAQTVYISDEAMLSALFYTFYVTDQIGMIPRIIFDAYFEDYQLLAGLVLFWNVAFTDLAEGMHFSVQCREDISFMSQDTAQARAGEYPLYADFALEQPDMDVCALWDVGQADPLENEPVRSDVPTLILSGEFDPVTPPAYGEQIGTTFANAYVYEFAALGHGVTRAHQCPLLIMMDFLADPAEEPNTACIGNMLPVQFVTPLTP